MSSTKRIILYCIAALSLIACYFAWRSFKSATSFDTGERSVYIKPGSDITSVESQLEKIINNVGDFSRLAKLTGYSKNIKPGKYDIENGASVFGIVRLLKSGKQSPVNLVINKLRLKEDLAKKIASNFDCDSLSVINFLNNSDSLALYHLDSNTVMTAIVPNTYSLTWNTTFPKIFKRLYNEQEKFWTGERKQKAAALGLSPQQVYTLASIVEEETNKEEDKGKIASVYLNRMEKGMPLGADPTIKFAMKDFGLKRILNKHLSFPSPYNTYTNKGLPPGPICTPSQKTIDASLNAPATSYLYFVAKPDFRGYSNFASTYEEHMRFAKAYQQALDTLLRKKAMNPAQ